MKNKPVIIRNEELFAFAAQYNQAIGSLTRSDFEKMAMHQTLRIFVAILVLKKIQTSGTFKVIKQHTQELLDYLEEGMNSELIDLILDTVEKVLKEREEKKNEMGTQS